MLLLRPRLPIRIKFVNKHRRRVSSVFLVKLDFSTLLSMKNVLQCLKKTAFPKCSNSKKDKEISLFKVLASDKTNDESIK